MNYYLSLILFTPLVGAFVILLVNKQNANAIRWGTLYNIRFDANTAPLLMRGTIGFFKTGAPMEVQVLAPRRHRPDLSNRP